MKHLLLPFLIMAWVSLPAQETKTSHRSCCTPKVSDKDWYTSDKKAPLFKGLEGVDYPIATRHPEAQAYFNQGMMLSYGFNHAEAARSFYESIKIDSSCAMCWWGFALVLGPNYNGGMEDDNIQRAYHAVQTAARLSAAGIPKEKDLVAALAQRYADGPVASRADLDSSYAAAMAAVHEKYPGDDEIAALYAEALMNQHPWDLWEKSGEAKPWTPRILTTLEQLLQKNPRHAGANHFYIHATEASAHPGMAAASADLLGDLVPGSGHLVHMPAHTYIRTGRYHEASLANIAAIKVDSNYLETCHAFGVYPLAYYPHNYHFLSATATLEGDRRTAMMAARKVAELSDQKLMRDSVWGTLQHYFSIPYYVMVKFGMWDELLKEPAVDPDLTYPNAVLIYAKGMAELFRNKNPEKARKHLATLKTMAADENLAKITVWYLNPVTQLLEIAALVLEGEILANERNYEAALGHLAKAVELEDALNYDEPPDWFFSVRHHKGAVQLEAGMNLEAEKTYRDDLNTFPENGWALIGLYRSLSTLPQSADLLRMAEADRVKQLFETAWKHADTAITSSRIK